MILKSITLENFRPFFGYEVLTFAERGEHNVTVVYGPNGGGKTALLNAFTWTLFNRTSPGFEEPHDLINHRAWAETEPGSEVSARAVVVFEHDHQVYTVERVTTDRKNPDGSALRIRDAHVSVTFVDKGGRSYDRTDTAEGTINQILPERLHRFFFFDGERIEHLVKPDSYAEIEDAIKTILGLKTIERAIDHLDDARKTLEKEYSKVAGEEVKQVADDLETARAEKAKKVAHREETVANRSARQTQFDNVNARLAQLEEAADLQRRREELEDALETVRIEIGHRHDSLASKLNDRGFLALSATLADEATSTFETLRTKREIPAPIKRQFVEDLLESGECICGAELHQGTTAHARVADWRQKAGRPDVETAWTQLAATAKHFGDQRSELFGYIHETKRELAGLDDQRGKIEDKLSQIKESISHLGSKEIQELEHRRDALRQEIDDDNLSVRIADGDIQAAEKRIADLERQLEDAGKAIERAKIAQRRVVVAREARDFCARVLDLQTVAVRQQIDERVKEVYSRITFKPYVPMLDDEFRLRLRTRVGGEEISVAKSTGENQILSLAFVGATAEHAQSRHAASSANAGADGALPAEGGIYPMVMDSPFGSLDENYQREIAEAIPQLAPQVVLLVSKSQGLHAVQDVVLPRVGREYVIEFHTPKPDQPRETITLQSGVHPYIERSADEFELATIKEV